MDTPLPSPDDFTISELPNPSTECGTCAALNVVRVGGNRRWVSGFPDSVKEVAIAYSANRAAETQAFRNMYPVGDSPQGIHGGMQKLYGVDLGMYRPAGLIQFLKEHIYWAFAIPLSASELKGPFYDIDHFQAAHRTPSTSGHMISVNIVPQGLWRMEPMHAMGTPNAFVSWLDTNLGSLQTAYEAWGRDSILGLQRGSLLPVVPTMTMTTTPEVPMERLQDPARVFDGSLEERTKIAIQIGGVAGVPSGIKEARVIIRVVGAPASGWLYLGKNPTRPLGSDPAVGGEPSLFDFNKGDTDDFPYEIQVENDVATFYSTVHLSRCAIDVTHVGF